MKASEGEGGQTDIYYWASGGGLSLLDKGLTGLSVGASRWAGKGTEEAKRREQGLGVALDGSGGVRGELEPLTATGV